MIEEFRIYWRKKAIPRIMVNAQLKIDFTSRNLVKT